ncbi:MAG: hypothetical protein AD073_000014 [Mycoplasmataceae bacterium]|nr:MAG: hypothetical protein AD073_000014 [Mycoplasmataceae bacterium]
MTNSNLILIRTNDLNEINLTIKYLEDRNISFEYYPSVENSMIDKTKKYFKSLFN